MMNAGKRAQLLRKPFIIALLCALMLTVGAICFYFGWCLWDGVSVYALSPEGQLTTWYNRFNQPCYIDDANYLYYAANRLKIGATIDEWAFPSLIDDEMRSIQNQGSIIAVDTDNHSIIRYYFDDGATQIVEDANGNFILKDYTICCRWAVGYDIDTSSSDYPYKFNNSATSGLVTSNSNYPNQLLDLKGLDLANDVLYSSIDVIDKDGNLIIDGEQPYLYDYSVYKIVQSSVSYAGLRAWVSINPYNPIYDGTLKCYIYAGELSDILYSTIDSIEAVPVYEYEAVTDIVQGTYVVEDIQYLYEVSKVLDYKQQYTIVLSARPEDIDDYHVIGYWGFNVQSPEAGMQDITNSYLEDDLYGATTDELRDKMQAEQNKLAVQMGFIGQPSQNIPTDFDTNGYDYEATLLDIFTALYGVFSFLAPVWIVIAALALISYILFGKGEN